MDREYQVKIWDPEDGREMLTFANCIGSAWSPDGLRLACQGTKHAPAPIMIFDATIGYALSRSGAALAGLDRWLDSHTSDLRFLRRRAEVLSAMGEWDKSAEDYRQILASAKSDASHWFETGWWICGPRSAAPNSDLPQEEQLDPAPPRQAVGPSQMGWKTLSTETERLSFGDLIEPSEAPSGSVVYAQKRLWTPKDLKLQLAVDSEVPVKVWVNRKVASFGTRPSPDEVALTAGWNTLVAEVPFCGTNTLLAKLSLAR